MPKMLLESFNAKAAFIKAFAPEKILDDVAQKKDDLKLKKAAFEPEKETYIRGMFWRSKGFLEQKGLTSLLRTVKRKEELAAVKKSCYIAAKAFSLVRPRIKTGITELAAARMLEDSMKDMGAKGVSFELIVAFGPNSALPHHITSQRRLKKDEAVLLDYGCVYDDYCSDMTRTFFNGRPDDEYRKVYAIVKKAHAEGIAALKAGLKAKKIDGVCRRCIADEGYGQYFIHSTGHGVWLEIHEEPWLNMKSDEILRPGMVVTVEPGIYLPGKFGIRIEDTVVITDKGREILTKAQY